MNNMKYYNDSLAYDFEMFMPKKVDNSEKTDNVIVMPKSKAVKRRQQAATKSLSVSASLVMLGVFVLMGLCGNIALRLKINEVNADINDIKSDISELDSEKTSLEVEMQRRVSYANLELEAMQLGMVKLQKDNVNYIRVNDKDIAKTANGDIVAAE